MAVKRKMIKVAESTPKYLKALAENAENQPTQINYLDNLLRKEAQKQGLLNADGSVKGK
jgi:hypothetical protein